LRHHFADLGHNHLETLAVRTIHSRLSCHDATGESMQRVKLKQHVCLAHTLYDLVLAGVEIFFKFRAPRFRNATGPALP